MNILVTGHTGYIGGVLGEQLESAGHSVIGFDHAERSADDVRDLARVRAVVEEGDVDLVYHLAAEADVWVDDWQRLVATNVLGTVNVATAAKEVGASVVFASSVAASGEYNRYGRSKQLAEEAMTEFDHVMTVRFPNVVGGDAPRGQAHDMIAEGLEGEIEVWGQGEIRRSYVDVRDLCTFLRRRDFESFEPGQTVFAHTKTNQELGRVIERVIADETGEEPELTLVDRSPPSPQVLTGEGVRVEGARSLEESIRSQVRAMVNPPE